MESSSFHLLPQKWILKLYVYYIYISQKFVSEKKFPVLLLEGVQTVMALTQDRRQVSSLTCFAIQVVRTK
jgi:hypothetical protein